MTTNGHKREREREREGEREKWCNCEGAHHYFTMPTENKVSLCSSTTYL